jgi:DNA polymerase-1
VATETTKPHRSRPLLALLDSHSLAYRAFFALPDDLRTTTGQLTNAVYGFTSMLIKLLAEYQPEGIAAVFDRGRPAERLELMPDYKANRAETPDEFRSQLPLIDEVLDALAVPRVGVDRQEADDLIATYARQADEAGMDTLVVTGDRDIFQLADEHTTVLYTRRGITETVEMDATAVEERYGVPPGRYPDLAALRGDPSDNIPGVPGVGDKTAAKLLTEHAGLDALFANLEEVKGQKLAANLAEHRQAALDGRAVVRLRDDLPAPQPVGELRMDQIDADAVRRVFATLEFRALWERLNSQVLNPQASEQATGFASEPIHAGAGELAEWLRAREPGQPVAVLASSTGRPPAVGLEAVALAADGASPLAAELAELCDDDAAELASVLAEPTQPLVTHGVKGLLHAAGSRGWRLAGVTMDTELAAYLVRPQDRTYDLAELAMAYLNKHLARDESPGRGEAEARQPELDTRAGEAAIDRTDLALRTQALLELAAVMEGELDQRDQRALLTDLELPLVAPLAAMEHAGIAVDLGVLAEIGDTLGDRISALQRDIYEQCGTELNLDSPKQLQAVLFDQLGLPKTKKIKTGYSTDAAALATIAHTHPVVELIQSYREVAKLKHTYIDALPPLVNAETGRIHAEFNQTAAVTGRLSSQDPNMQNMPIRTETGKEIRRAFVPGDDYEALLVADYSQIELRVMAHLSGDRGLLEAFASGEDIHTTTAAMVWELPTESVDNESRSRIKRMTYGLAYGLSAFGLGQQLGIPPDEARELMDAYFARFPAVRDYLYGQVEAARKDGYTATVSGRRRYLPDLMSDNRQRREMAERMALNAPIQGTAADIIKAAMVAVHDALTDRGLASRALLQVHDELVLEVAPGEAEGLRPLVAEAMGGVADLEVPLEVDTAMGPSWAQAEKH